MGSVKWMMFNLHFWSSMSDLVISCIGIPFILLPAPAGYGLGFVDAPRLMTYCMATLLADSKTDYLQQPADEGQQAK
ncbi:hypothetical protein L5515_006827 [Caenorhabditis briggsae]|uniref:Uncharacterized protein n=1 Tax=Caenorhabditis briggsae TaxID=6238 RepID=A0AAE9EWV2_CAEBR|nr:hypothetical protein L5515_006827 [Caenorhabditis briggsae]